MTFLYSAQDWDRVDLDGYNICRMIFRNDTRNPNQYTKLTEEEAYYTINEYWKSLESNQVFVDVPELVTKDPPPAVYGIPFRRACIGRLIYELTLAKKNVDEPKKVAKHLNTAHKIFVKGIIKSEAFKATTEFAAFSLEFKTQILLLTYQHKKDLDYCTPKFTLIETISNKPGLMNAFTKNIEPRILQRLEELKKDIEFDLNSFPIEKLFLILDKFLADVCLDFNALYKPNVIGFIISDINHEEEPRSMHSSPQKPQKKRKFNQPHESAKHVEFEEGSENDDEDQNIFSTPNSNHHAERKGKRKVVQEIPEDINEEGRREEYEVEEDDDGEYYNPRRSASAQNSSTSTPAHVPACSESKETTPKRLIFTESTSESQNLIGFRTPVKKNTWTQDELDALTEGMEKYGPKWALIWREYGDLGNKRIPGRNQVQLKDKARVEKGRRLKEGIPLGPYQRACSRS